MDMSGVCVMGCVHYSNLSVIHIVRAIFEGKVNVQWFQSFADYWLNCRHTSSNYPFFVLIYLDR